MRPRKVAEAQRRSQEKKERKRKEKPGKKIITGIALKRQGRRRKRVLVRWLGRAQYRLRRTQLEKKRVEGSREANNVIVQYSKGYAAAAWRVCSMAGRD